jgi:hypothetical protein
MVLSSGKRRDLPFRIRTHACVAGHRKATAFVHTAETMKIVGITP